VSSRGWVGAFIASAVAAARRDEGRASVGLSGGRNAPWPGGKYPAARHAPSSAVQWVRLPGEGEEAGAGGRLPVLRAVERRGGCGTRGAVPTKSGDRVELAARLRKAERARVDLFVDQARRTQ